MTANPGSNRSKPEILNPSSDQPASRWPRMPIAMLLVGIALMALPIVARPVFAEYGFLLVVAGGVFAAIGLKTTIMELPNVHVPTWLGLAIIITLGLSLPVAFAVMWLLSKLNGR